MKSADQRTGHASNGSSPFVHSPLRGHGYCKKHLVQGALRLELSGEGCSDGRPVTLTGVGALSFFVPFAAELGWAFPSRCKTARPGGLLPFALRLGGNATRLRCPFLLDEMQPGAE